MKINDVVRWWNADSGCSRCGDKSAYYVKPYWDRSLRVCPACCHELNQVLDRVGWPDWPE